MLALILIINGVQMRKNERSMSTNSESKYPTLNLFLPVLWTIKNALNEEIPPGKTHMENMIVAM